MSSPQRLSSQSSFSSFDSVAQGWRCSTHNMFVTPQVQLLQSHSCQLSAFGMPLTNSRCHGHPTNPSDRKAFTLCLRITGIMLSASPSEVLDSNAPNSLEPRCMEILHLGVSLSIYIYTLTNLFKLVPV